MDAEEGVRRGRGGKEGGREASRGGRKAEEGGKQRREGGREENERRGGRLVGVRGRYGISRVAKEMMQVWDTQMETPLFIPGSLPGCPSTHSRAMSLWGRIPHGDLFHVSKCCHGIKITICIHVLMKHLR